MRGRWVEGRRAELLPTPYPHVVFTLPHQLAPLALQNKEVIYALLFRASAQTLIEVASDPRHLGAEIGFFSVLHTWNQKLQHHPHIHCVVAAGGLSGDHTHWIKPRNPHFFLPKMLSARSFAASLWKGFSRLTHKNKKRLLTLPVDEFLRRFLLHALPRGFVRIRHFGFLASRRRRVLLPACRQALSAAPEMIPATTGKTTGTTLPWICLSAII